MTRVVLVTGANRGIGHELARQLALRGDVVVLTARDLAKVEQAAAALPDHQRVLARRLDVTDPASVQQVAATSTAAMASEDGSASPRRSPTPWHVRTAVQCPQLSRELLRPVGVHLGQAPP
jgi:NAD(P)-dependent dehydrogenase (short-subunit alcohol dehydrogenase family)